MNSSINQTMSSFHLLSSPLHFHTSQHSQHSKLVNFLTTLKFTPFYHIKPPHLRVSSINGDNGAIESPTPPRRGRKKKSDTTPSKKSKLSRKTNAENGSLEAKTEENTPNKGETIEKNKTPPKKSKLSSKTNAENGSLEAATEETIEKTKTPPKKSKLSSKTNAENDTLEAETEENTANKAETTVKESIRWRRTLVELGVYEPRTVKEGEIREEDGENDEEDLEFHYDEPPLICCFGAVQKEFVPSVRVHEYPMDADIYSEWKMLQWKPPEFGRAPGGPVSNVAIAHVRLGGRAAFMGKVGDDSFGDELVLMMNKEKVQTRAVKFDDSVKTGCSYMNVKFEDGKMKMEVSKESAEDSLNGSELNLSVIKEARLFHFNSEVLTSPSMQSTLFKAIELSKKFGGLVFFDPNLPLPLWKSRDETRQLINKAWSEADYIEVSKPELEFLLDEEFYERKRNYRPQYYAENYEQTKRHQQDYYHYTPEEISPLWHDKLKALFVTDGTLRIHYYTPNFHGVVIGTEDVLITPYTCDRTGSGDAIVAALIRKLTTCPEMLENQDIMDRQLRFAVAAGIIAQWTIGAVRGFPTESAAQNLKEQVYVPSMW